MTGTSLTDEPPTTGPAWLQRLLVDLDVSWCLLRDAPTAPAHGQDVDLLVAPSDLPTFHARLSEAGFARIPRPSRGYRLLYVRYDAESDAWPKIDVSTALRFGPHKELASGLARGILGRRRRWGTGVVTPAPGDAFWLLLLHALLDKGHVRRDHQEQLARLVRHARDTDEPARYFGLAGGGVSPRLMVELVRSGRWEALDATAPPMLQELRRRQRPRWWWRALEQRMRRRALRYGLWPWSRGLVVGFPDRSVDTLQLARRLPFPVRTTVVRGGSKLGSGLGTRACGIVLRDGGPPPPADLVVATDLPQTRPSGTATIVHIDPRAPLGDRRVRLQDAVWNAYGAQRSEDRHGDSSSQGGRGRSAGNLDR